MSWPIAFGGGFENAISGFDNIRFIARIYNKPIDDVIAFVDGQGRSSTGGKKAFNVLVGGVPAMLMPQARNDIWIALADSGSGLVIAFVHGIASDGKTEADPESIFSQPLASGLQKAHVGWVRPPPPAK